MSEKKINLEKILNAKNLHTYYYPNGDFKQKMIHDDDCAFCKYEIEVLEAMIEFGKQLLELAAENAQTEGGETGFVNKQSIVNTIDQVE